MIAPIFDHVDSDDFTRLKCILNKEPGYNQSDQASMLAANNDSEAIIAFLLDYRNSKLTYRSYLKEIERLVLWCCHVPKITISDLKREHLIGYREFLASPEPHELWCAARCARMLDDGNPNPAWRPFAKGLSAPSIRKTLSILDSFFNYLVHNNYLAGNPLGVDKRRRGKKSNSTDRWLERDEINTVLAALAEHACTTPSARDDVTRARYIILTLFYTGLRLAELTQHRMGDFTLVEGNWYLRVVGKGEKPRRIVVVDEYLDVLTHYRQTLNLNPTPSFNEPTALVPTTHNNNTPLCDSRVWQILKWAFALGATRYESASPACEQEALQNQHKAQKLRAASTHWLRHSYGTYLVKSGCPIEKVKELMGHADISTTMIYVHMSNHDLHASAQGLTLSEQASDRQSYK